MSIGPLRKVLLVQNVSEDRGEPSPSWLGGEDTELRMKCACNLACLVLAALFCLWAGQLRAQENYALTEVTFHGNQTFSDKQLLLQVAMYPTGAFKRKILGKDPFLYSEEILESDLQRLVRFYQREGFLYVKAEKSRLEASRAKKTVKLSIQITEGQPVLVDRVHYNIAANSPKDEKLADEILNEVRPTLSLQPATRFTDDNVHSDAARIVEKFHQSGFPYVTSDYELEVRQAAVDVHWHITAGMQCTFGDVTVTGNSRVPESLIRKHLSLRKGQVFDPVLLDESQERIYGLGFFQIVTVKGLLIDPKVSVVPVQVEVKEVPRLIARFGIGFNREEKFRAFATLTRLGTLGGTRRLELSLKHSSLEPHHVDLKLTQPSFPTTKTTLILNPFLLRQDEPGFEVSRRGVNLTAQHKLGENIDGHITYGLEWVEQMEGEGAKNQADQGQSDLYNKSGVTVGLKRDTSSPIFEPSHGLLTGAAFTISGLGFNSEFHFSKWILDMRRYNGLLDLAVLASRIKLGSLTSHDEDEFVPVEERFFAGGASSVRGWARSELGPLDEDGTPIGGKSLLEASLEMRYHIWKPFSGVAFTDFGNVWLGSLSYDLADLRYSVGLGLRVSTPIGPMRLDVARPVFDEEESVQLHLSVGHAF